MALVLKSGSARRSSSMGALFVSNPKKKRNVRKRKNVAKKRKTTTRRKTTARKRKSTRRVAKRPAKRIVLKLNPMRMKKRKNVAKKRVVRKRKNALALKRRKNGTRKGMMRKTSRKAYMKRRNPARKRKSSRRVVRRLIRNPERSMEIKSFSPVKKAVAGIPLFGKKIAPYVGCSLIGMAVIVPYNMAYDKISSYIQSATWLPQPLKAVDKYAGIALSGLGIAALAKYLLSKSGLVSKQFASSSACAIAIISGGAQFLRLREMYKSGELYGKKDVSTSVEVAADGSVQGLAFMGDGMAYDVVPMSGVHMGAMHGMYADASPKDAAQCPHDLDAKEKAMALRGVAAWHRAFGQCPYLASSQNGCSRYAGKHGHRWGWLIKVLGWDRFAKLCKMSAPNRIRAISQIKIACINSAQKSFDASYKGLAMDMGGLAYSQDSYSGLAMVGSAH